MKSNSIKILGIVAISALFSCKSSTNTGADSTSADSMSTSEASYVNLSTGEPVTVVKDTEEGYYVYSDTKQPIEDNLFFVDVNTRDTLYGRAGVVVNNAIIKSDAGYSLNEDMIERNGDEIKVKTADGKLKIDGDEMKYKEGDDKIKVDGEDSKTKTDDSKTKVDGEDSKTKTSDTKIKVDN